MPSMPFLFFWIFSTNIGVLFLSFLIEILFKYILIQVRSVYNVLDSSNSSGGGPFYLIQGLAQLLQSY